MSAASATLLLLNSWSHVVEFIAQISQVRKARVTLTRTDVINAPPGVGSSALRARLTKGEPPTSQPVPHLAIRLTYLLDDH